MKKSELLVLDPKRSNAINIGMTVLPAVHVIKTAILNFDEFAISKEGIEVRPGSGPDHLPGQRSGDPGVRGQEPVATLVQRWLGVGGLCFHSCLSPVS